MATSSDLSALKPSNSTTALLRAWIQFVEDILVAGGWVVTSDTGQLVISTAAVPTTANQKVGYRIYRMADTLQATKPIFMRIDYGGGAGSAGVNPAMWFTFGEGTNGSGTITTIRYNGGVSTTPQVAAASAAATGTFSSYGSAANNRAQIGLFICPTLSRMLFFSVERTKDATGADTGAGLIFIWGDVADGGSVGRNVIIAFAGAAQPPVELGLNYVLSSSNPSAFSGDVGIGIPIPINAVAQPPGVGVVVVRSSDFIAEAQFAVTIYGVSHTYQHLNALTAGKWVGSYSPDGTSVLCMRFD